jgi:hypothetical protein
MILDQMTADVPRYQSGPNDSRCSLTPIWTKWQQMVPDTNLDQMTADVPWYQSGPNDSRCSLIPVWTKWQRMFPDINLDQMTADVPWYQSVLNFFMNTIFYVLSCSKILELSHFQRLLLSSCCDSPAFCSRDICLVFSPFTSRPVYWITRNYFFIFMCV